MNDWGPIILFFGIPFIFVVMYVIATIIDDWIKTKIETHKLETCELHQTVVELHNEKYQIIPTLRYKLFGVFTVSKNLMCSDNKYMEATFVPFWYIENVIANLTLHLKSKLNTQNLCIFNIYKIIYNDLQDAMDTVVAMENSFGQCKTLYLEKLHKEKMEALAKKQRIAELKAGFNVKNEIWSSHGKKNK